MSDPQGSRYDSVARQWLALVERRQEHIIELSKSGRWRHYFTQTEFLEEMRRVLRLRDQWATLAGEPSLAESGMTDTRVVSLEEERQYRRERGLRRLAVNGGSVVPAPPWPD